MTREDLRNLIDRLPDDQLEQAGRLLGELSRSKRSFDEFLASVPEDDEPTTEEERAAIAEAREDYRQGRTIPLSDVARRPRPAPRR